MARTLLALFLSCLFAAQSASAAEPVSGFTTLSDAQWDESAVRRVLHTFAYGGAASDSQIAAWADMHAQDAVAQMLTFAPSNPLLSPAADGVGAAHGASLRDLQAFLGSDAADNGTCPTERSRYATTKVRNDGEVVPNPAGLQYSWMSAMNLRGLNPFRHVVGFWLANYHMAVNLADTEPRLVQAMYDQAMADLAAGKPFHEVLAGGASSAAVAREYGHRSNRYDNDLGSFEGNDDFAREFHQLFFRINGENEDPDYHENTTIEHTAWALSGMQLDKVPNLDGATLTADWFTAPIDFSDHVDATGRSVRNTRFHYQGALEILHETIVGSTADEMLRQLSAVAVRHPDSLKNLPVEIVRFFADDHITDDKAERIRAEWAQRAGQPNDLLEFLRAYAVSVSFHRADTYKYRTAFSRNMTIFDLNTVDNAEAFGNPANPRAAMTDQGAEMFFPANDVFGGQTSLNAANNPNLFKEAFNAAVDAPLRVAKPGDACKDSAGATLWQWRKAWGTTVPRSPDSSFRADDVGRWLWQRFIGDGGAGYGVFERAQVVALLATGLDFGLAADPSAPGTVYTLAELSGGPLAQLIDTLGATALSLDAIRNADRSTANRRVGLAINFIVMTPAMFAQSGVLPVPVAAVAVPDLQGLDVDGAQAALGTAGLQLGGTHRRCSEVAGNGTVIAQVPAAGTEVAPDSFVDVTLAWVPRGNHGRPGQCSGWFPGGARTDD